MIQADLAEAAAVLRRLLPVIATVPTDARSTPAALMRREIGLMDAEAEALIRGANLGTSLLASFQAGVAAGATIDTLDRVRAAAGAEIPAGRPAAIIVTGIAHLALAHMALLVADTAITSRSQADALRARLSDAFIAAIDAASVVKDSAGYRALSTLHAQMVRDLTARARPLPAIVPYTFPIRHSILWIANRLYGDGGRFDEVLKENRVIHPLFAPESGRALAR